MLTWSLGCTGDLEPIVPPSISIARFEITSLAFMFDCVPEPVCQTTMTVAGSQGHFELNVFNPVMAYNFLQSVKLMGDAAVSFTDHCVAGIEAREDNIKAALERSLMLVTALAPKIGYDNAAKIAKTAHKNGTTLRDEAVGGGYVTNEEFDALVRPEKMISPG